MERTLILPFLLLLLLLFPSRLIKMNIPLTTTLLKSASSLLSRITRCQWSLEITHASMVRLVRRITNR